MNSTSPHHTASNARPRKPSCGARALPCVNGCSSKLLRLPSRTGASPLSAEAVWKQPGVVDFRMPAGGGDGGFHRGSRAGFAILQQHCQLDLCQFADFPFGLFAQLSHRVSGAKIAASKSGPSKSPRGQADLSNHGAPIWPAKRAASALPLRRSVSGRFDVLARCAAPGSSNGVS